MSKLNLDGIKLVVTDADGTLWQFTDYFCPAMRVIVPRFAEQLGLSMDEVSIELGRVLVARGTHEYPWALEESKFRRDFKGSPAEFRDQFSRPFWEAMDKYRLKYLSVFDEVFDTICELRRRGIKLAILSDAPYHMAVTRARQMQLDGLISGLYALETKAPPVNELVDPEDLNYGRERLEQFLSTSHRFEITRELPVDYEKPNPRGLALAMNDFGVTPDQVLVIGDSTTKDGGVADQFPEVRYVWARYGICISAQDRELISSHFNPTATLSSSNPCRFTYSKATRPPMVAKAAAYSDLLNHLGKTWKPLEPGVLDNAVQAKPALGG